MRRYLPTLILLVILLALGGSALYFMDEAAIPLDGAFARLRGYYLPTLSADAQTGSTQGLLLVGAAVVAIFGTFGMGIALAIGFNQLNKMQAVHVPEEESTGRSGPRPPAEAPADIPLSDNRSLTVFWIIVTVASVGYLILRFGGQPLGYLPLAEMINMPLFRLPGEHIEGLPPFIAGPGDMVTALHLFLAVLGGAVVTTVAIGIGLARGLVQLDQTVQEADKLPPTPLDKLTAKLIAETERRIEALRSPKPKAPPTPRSWVDQGMAALNVLLVLAVIAIVAVYVVPSFGTVAEVDRALEATRQAAGATPIAVSGGSVLSPEALQAEYAALPGGDAARGEAVFTSAGCAACHSLDTGVTVVGPPLAGIAGRAAARQTGATGALYVYESVVSPNAVVADGFQPGLMPATFKLTLTPQDLADVVAYVLEH